MSNKNASSGSVVYASHLTEHLLCFTDLKINEYFTVCSFFMRNNLRVSGRTGNHTCKHAHWHSCADSANFSAAVAFAEDETLTSKVPNMLLVVVALAHFHWRHIWRELVSQNCVDVRTFMFKTAPNQSL